MVRVIDVPLWLRLSGKSHALQGEGTVLHFTLCGVATPNGEKHRVPKRICGKCRKLLDRTEVLCSR